MGSLYAEDIDGIGGDGVRPMVCFGLRLILADEFYAGSRLTAYMGSGAGRHNLFHHAVAARFQAS